MIPGRTEVLNQHVKNPADPSAAGDQIFTSWCPRCRAVAPVDAPPCDCDQAKCVCAKSAGCHCKHDLRRCWLVSPLEDRIGAQFEMEVRRRARIVYKSLEREDPAEADRLRDLYNEDSIDGLYNWDDGGIPTAKRNHVKMARSKMWGALYLMYLLLRRADGGPPEQPDGPVTERVATAICDSNPRDWMRCYLQALGLTANKPEEPVPNVPTPAQAVAGAATTVNTNSSVGAMPVEAATFD